MMIDPEDAPPLPPIELEIEAAFSMHYRPHAVRVAPLIDLLRSEGEIPRAVRNLLADLFDEAGRGEFKAEIKRRGRGRPPPIFTKTYELELEAVQPLAQKMRAGGVKAPKKSAYKKIAAKRDLKPETLERYSRKRNKPDSK